MKFRKKPVTIDAVQFGPDTKEQDFYDGFGWSPSAMFPFKKDGTDLIIPTLEGGTRAHWGDWVIRGVHGEFYACKPAVFELTYEKAEEHL